MLAEDRADRVDRVAGGGPWKTDSCSSESRLPRSAATPAAAHARSTSGDRSVSPMGVQKTTVARNVARAGAAGSSRYAGRPYLAPLDRHDRHRPLPRNLRNCH
ncbi:MAG TPA: hypothetical protein VF838_13080 [Trebonia sp.]